MRLLAGWRLPLRIARREALRHRGRSLLVVLMIALPVLGVTAADVLTQTSQVSGSESVERRMGASEALVTATEGGGTVQQRPDPDQCCTMQNYADDAGLPLATAEQISSLLDGARLVEIHQGQTQVQTDKGRTTPDALEVDLRDPVAAGLVELTSGRLPQADDEVVVNEALAERGYAVGDTLELTADGAPSDPTIVGTAESTGVRGYPFAAGPLGSLGADVPGSSAWLVDGAPVTWASVKQLNQIGATVASRAVIEDPPPASEQYAALDSVGGDDGTLGVVALIVTMIVLEVVLLAGPAFAVGARQQQRSLALMAASGGTPRQAKRVITAGALVLGGAGAALGVVLGILVAVPLVPVLQRYSISAFGPFDVPWLHLVAVAAFGLASAFLAAVVPAHLASRQDVVAVLAGRRGDPKPSLRSPLLGLVLLGAGVGGSVLGALRPAGGETVIAVSALPAVLGMILLVPVVLALLAKVAGRLPLVLRYAVRDAQRHRTRTVPAVAAVAATVAGVVTLSIGLSSDQRENQETYQASLVDGVGIVRAYSDDTRWEALRDAVERELPAATVTEEVGISDFDGYTQVAVPDRSDIIYSTGDRLGANVMVSDGPVPVGLLGLSEADTAKAEAALADGVAVAFTSPGVEVDASQIVVSRDSYDPETGEQGDSATTIADAVFLPIDRPASGPSAIVPPAVAEELGVAPETVALAVSGVHVSEQQETDVNEAVLGVVDTGEFYVERGFRPDDAAFIIQLVLIGLGGVLMLGGTLTATFIALSDARPDLATLAAVGASPRTRRGVAAAYAVVVGGVGAVLGAAVGFIPGLAITWPLTRGTGGTCTVEGSGSCIASGIASGPFIDVPWLWVIGLVVVLPLLTAALVGVTARARLPLVARLD